MKGNFPAVSVNQTKTTTAEQLQRAREIFEAASAEHGTGREAVLRRGCNGNPELRMLVEQMIVADDKTHPILDHPLSLAGSGEDFDAGALQEGSQVGPYRVIRQIGEGGMGKVYLAQFADMPGPDLFAIKVVRWWSHELSRRFRREQAILSSLRHANIARFIDGATTEDHNPYFVMEYVEGQSIHHYCEQNSLSVGERLRLFRQVCAAVHYLHQNLVIHRDLKPGNVLVTADGAVKLVDFGISKLLQPADENPSPFHTTAPGLMTPDYASPEQIRGVPTSTLTDVYSLGILLYELLTGVLPFSDPEGRIHETLRRISEEEPLRPSVAVLHGSPDRRERRRRSRKLRGELDNIVLKAIRKAPEQRYASVEQFDEDLRRYLSALPVLAQGESGAYRLWKFVARHKAGVATGLVMLVLLVGGIIATSIEARIAGRERAWAEVRAREAEHEKSIAESQTRIAEQERARAERQQAEAQAQRAKAERQQAEAQAQREKAERRLSELQKLAGSAVQIYNSAHENGSPQAPALIAENARDSLRVLKNELSLEPADAGLLDTLSAELASDQLTTDRSWHIPSGWTGEETKTGEYRAGLDHQVIHHGQSSLFLHSLVPDPVGFVSVTQSFRAERFRGRRMRLAGYLRGQKIAERAFLVLGIRDQREVEDGDHISLSGTSAWRKYELVVDVPADADSISIRITMRGAGTLWADQFSFQPVSLWVPLTKRVQPQNLGFTK